MDPGELAIKLGDPYGCLFLRAPFVGGFKGTPTGTPKSIFRGNCALRHLANLAGKSVELSDESMALKADSNHAKAGRIYVETKSKGHGS